MVDEKTKIILLKDCVNKICLEQEEKENNHGTYDVRESLMAIWKVQGMADSIEAVTSKDYMDQLEWDITEAKNSTKNPGKENGGLGTYNGLLNNVLRYYQSLLESERIQKQYSQEQQSGGFGFLLALIIAITLIIFLKAVK